MKKVYQKPMVEFIKLECEDIITCSNGFPEQPKDPGCGHGNSGHGHNNGHGFGPIWHPWWPWW